MPKTVGLTLRRWSIHNIT